MKNILSLLFISSVLILPNVSLAFDCPNNSSFNDLSQTCECVPGYIAVSSKCVQADQYCKDSFGINSRYNTTSEKCECNYGYIALSGQCVNATAYCHDKGGIHSVYDPKEKSCKCDYGYIPNSDEYCISQSLYCSELYGDKSEYNKSTERCVCKSGYYLNNEKCIAIEILSISPDSGIVGDKIKIKGNNLGSIESRTKIYVGENLIDTLDILSWSDKEIVFKIGSYLTSGEVKLKIDDEKEIKGQYLDISEEEVIKDEDKPSEDPNKITVNQQINISGVLPSDSQSDNAPVSITSASYNGSGVENEYNTKDVGFFSFASSFVAGILNGIKNIFANLFG